MKCSKCGQEFGDGLNCQHCGVDRVTGLANFNGYQGNAISSQSTSQNGSPSNTMVCHACGEIIPMHSIFCPYCSKNLYVTCPKCGSTYSSQFPACSNCGTNREIYYKQQEVERQKAAREKEERERRIREWEQITEGKAELERKTNMKLLLLFLLLCVCGIILTYTPIWYSLFPSWKNTDLISRVLFSPVIGFMLFLGLSEISEWLSKK